MSEAKITPEARRILEENGGSIRRGTLHFPTGTMLVNALDHQNTQYEMWLLLDDRRICWDANRG